MLATDLSPTGTWSVNVTPLYTIAAFDGDLIAYGTPSGGGADVASPAVTLTVYAPGLEGTLVVWIDADDASALTVTPGSPDTVTSVTNKASGVAWNTAMSVNYPVRTTSTNGRGALEGDGTTSSRGIRATEAAVLAALGGNDPAFTNFQVYETSVIDVTAYLLGAGLSTHASQHSAGFGTTTTGTGCLLYFRADGSATAVWDKVLTAAGQSIAESYSADGQNVTFRFNGGVTDSENLTTIGAVSPDRVGIMARPSSPPTGYFSGKFCEQLLFASRLSDAARDRVRDYLATKWGIALAGLVLVAGLSVVANDAYSAASPNVIQFRTPAATYEEAGVQKQVVCYADTSDRYRLKRRTLSAPDTWTLSSKIPFTGIGSTDPHNIAAIAVDGSGNIHCVASRHADPMAWVRTATPYDIESLPEVGTADSLLPGVPSSYQSGVTYVEFATFSNGDLLMIWRNGGSGNGNTHLARYDHATETWADLGMIIQGATGSPRTNAYTHEIHVDALDRVHVAWEWRVTVGGVVEAKNVQDVCYMISEANPTSASATWYTTPALTTPVTLPVTYHSSPPVVLAVPFESGLRESGGLATDTSGNPAICTFRCMTGAGEAGATHDSEYFVLAWNGSAFVESVVGGITADFHYPVATTGGPWLVPPKLFHASGKWHVVTGSYPQLDGIYVNSIADDLSGSWSGWSALYPHSEGSFGSAYGGTVGRACMPYDRQRWKNFGVLDIFVQKSIQCGMLEATLPA